MIDVIRSENKDQIIDTLNESVQMRYQGDLLPLLLDLWNKKTDKYPSLPWETINSPIISVSIANVLLQAQRNRNLDIDIAPMHEYVRTMTKSLDVQVKAKAILTLGVIGDSDDVPRLVKLSKNSVPQIFHVSILSLGDICGDGAENALLQLEERETTEYRRSYIRDVRRDRAALFKKTGGALCRNRPES